jgi:hypothetical protein
MKKINKEFKAFVYIGGKQYEIKDERIYHHYERAKRLVTHRREIIGYKS